MTLVVDASALIAGWTDDGPDGAWVEGTIVGHPLSGPHLLPVEVFNMLRKAMLAGRVSSDMAALAYGDLLDLQVELYGFEPFARRTWELRDNVTGYDAWYVALAEELQAPLVTLDHRLAAAPGLRCDVLVPPRA